MEQFRMEEMVKTLDIANDALKNARIVANQSACYLMDNRTHNALTIIKNRIEKSLPVTCRRQ